MVVVARDPWPFIPQIMDDCRGFPGFPVCFLPHFPVCAAQGTQGGVPEVPVIGKIIVFHRKGFYSSFQRAVDGILVAGKKPALTAFVEIQQPPQHTLPAPASKVHKQNT